MHARIVHEHVHRIVFRRDLGRCRADGRKGCQVDRDEGGIGTWRCHLAHALRCSLATFTVPAQHEDVCAHSRERRGGRQAQAARSARHHADAAQEIDHFVRGLARLFTTWSIHVTRMSPLAIVLAVALLTGTALHGVGALLHPMLTGDGATQLRTIADMAHWRELHLAMLAGSGLIVAGVWVRLVDDRAFVRAPLVTALALISLGVSLNGLNIAYMAGAGWHMATQFTSGDVGMVPLFEATHPIGLMAARFGNFLIALGAISLGWGEWHDAEPRRLDAALAWIAALGGLIGAMFFDESTRVALAAIALLSGWQVVTALRSLVLSPRRAKGTMPPNSRSEE